MSKYDKILAPGKVTVAIPTIPERGDLLNQALASVRNQTRQADDVVVMNDLTRAGGWATRNDAIREVKTEWTALLDDDDLLLPRHLEILMGNAEDEGYDLVWGWFMVLGGTDPFPDHRGRQFDINNPHIFPITVLCRTKFLLNCLDDIGGFQPDPEGHGDWEIQDFPVWKHIVEQGAGLHGYSDITWRWRHHGMNTSGIPRPL